MIPVTLKLNPHINIINGQNKYGRIVVEAGKKISILETITDHPANKQINSNLEIILEPKASLKHYIIQNARQHTGTYTRQVTQKESSTYRSFTLSVSSGFIQNETKIMMIGQQAKAELNGLTLATDAGHIVQRAHIYHQAPKCQSRELYKSLIKDKAVGVFNGNITASREATDTDAELKNQNILLSTTAKMYTSPQFEINTDDISCKHGATTGQLDESSLFYLRSRGLSRATARYLLLEGFINEVMNKLDQKNLKIYAQNLFKKTVMI